MTNPKVSRPVLLFFDSLIMRLEKIATVFLLRALVFLTIVYIEISKI